MQRRSFLKHLAAAVAVVVMPPTTPTPPPTTTTTTTTTACFESTLRNHVVAQIHRQMDAEAIGGKVSKVRGLAYWADR